MVNIDLFSNSNVFLQKLHWMVYQKLFLSKFEIEYLVTKLCILSQINWLNEFSSTENEIDKWKNNFFTAYKIDCKGNGIEIHSNFILQQFHSYTFNSYTHSIFSISNIKMHFAALQCGVWTIYEILKVWILSFTLKKIIKELLINLNFDWFFQSLVCKIAIENFIF